MEEVNYYILLVFNYCIFYIVNEWMRFLLSPSFSGMFNYFCIKILAVCRVFTITCHTSRMHFPKHKYEHSIKTATCFLRHQTLGNV